MTGLIIAKRCSSASTTATRRATPTWLAARPTPLAACIVSNRSSMKRAQLLIHAGDLGTALSAAPASRAGGSRSTLISAGPARRCRRPGRCGPARPPRVALPLSMVTRSSLMSLTLPMSPPAGGDLVALLERGEQRGVLLPGLVLGPHEQEVEDQADERDLERGESRHRTTARTGARPSTGGSASRGSRLVVVARSQSRRQVSKVPSRIVARACSPRRTRNRML